MNAGRILREAGIYGDALAVTLYPVLVDDVNVWPAARALRMLWRPGIRGVTLGSVVLVDPELLDGDRDRLARLVVHELVHVRQFSVYGFPGFMIRYIWEYLKRRLSGLGHQRAYMDNPFESEARQTAGRLAG